VNPTTVLLFLLAAAPQEPAASPPSPRTEVAPPPAQVEVAPPAPQATSAAPEPRVDVQVGYERRRDRYRYRFEHQSTIFDETLVPSFYEQRYVADNNWVVVRARYRASADLRWVVEGGLTPTATATASDLDTFYRPDGNVVVSGTRGAADMQSMRGGIWAERLSSGEAASRIGYSWRRDRADFESPIAKIVTTSRPASVEESVTFNHETTWSQVHEIHFGWSRSRAVGGKWRLTGDLDLVPTLIARLRTALPEKYPGQDVVSWTGGWDVGGRVVLARSGGVPIALSVDVARSGNYRPAGRFIRDALGVGISVGF
jgi:hypothetical protein